MAIYRGSGSVTSGENIYSQAELDAAVASALAAQTAAEAAQTAAELAETNAETAETNAETAETNAETAQTAAELAETNAETAQTAAELAETNAATSETNAAASAAAALVSENAAAADLVLTNADVVSTNADAASTASDASDTAADLVLTNADVVLTGLDVAATNADVVSTNADAVSTAADAVSTAADVVSCAASYDSFDDRYLGAKASDPTLDNDGDALLEGALYWKNTAPKSMMVYNGSTWEAASVPGATYYTKTETDAAFKPITFPGRNLIVNASMAVAQSGTSFLANLNNRSIDSWIFTGGGGNGTVTQESTVDPALPFAKFMAMAVTTTVTSQTVGIKNAMEGLDVAHLKIGTASPATVTLSWSSAHSITGTYCVTVRNNAINRSYILEYTQAVADTWQRHEATFDLDDTGTWDTGTGVGLSVQFCCGRASANDGTVDTWNAGNKFHTSNQVNLMGTMSATFRIGGVKLEEGSVATDFIPEDFAVNLTKCQRYYCKSYPYGHPSPDDGPTLGYGNGKESIYAITGTAAQRTKGRNIYWAQTMRATPTIRTFSTNDGAAGKAFCATSGTNRTIALSNVNDRSVAMSVSQGTSHPIYNLTWQWTATAEL